MKNYRKKHILVQLTCTMYITSILGLVLFLTVKLLKQLLYNYSTFTDISPFLRPLLIPI